MKIILDDFHLHVDLNGFFLQIILSGTLHDKLEKSHYGNYFLKYCFNNRTLNYTLQSSVGNVMITIFLNKTLTNITSKVKI